MRTLVPTKGPIPDDLMGGIARCALCEVRKNWTEFVIGAGLLSPFCNECRVTKRSYLRRRQKTTQQEWKSRVWATLRELALKMEKKKGRDTEMAEEHAVKLRKFPERVAAVAGKTFAVIGADAFTNKGLSDDQAIAMILDLLNELDPTLIDRNQKKALARLKRAS